MALKRTLIYPVKKNPPNGVNPISNQIPNHPSIATSQVLLHLFEFREKDFLNPEIREIDLDFFRRVKPRFVPRNAGRVGQGIRGFEVFEV